MKKFPLTYTATPLQKEIEVLGQGISDNAKEKRNLDPVQPFGFFIHDENNEIKGGCNGNIGYDWLYVDQLWVDKSLRSQGYGTALMQAALDLALERKCLHAAVNTGDWEALDFYKKLGFRVELQREGLANHSVFYFLRKELSINHKNSEIIQYHDENFYITESTPNENEYIDNALGDFNISKVPLTQENPLTFICYHIKNKDHHIIGGIKSILYNWNCLFVELLWIDDQHRNKDLGSLLLNKVENEALKLGCHLIHLYTYDFQAKDFYLKKGYEIFGVLDDCPKGHKRFYLKKSLAHKTGN
jgi:GNAT superfamily N-acetyltransferase